MFRVEEGVLEGWNVGSGKWEMGLELGRLEIYIVWMLVLGGWRSLIFLRCM